jgi:MoxR-like ATPase
MMDKYRRRNQAREKIIPDIQQLLENFLHSEIDLTRFREDFHLKTLAKGDWDLFGLKGHSGAQFLNMLVKYLPNQAETAGVLRKALTLPDDLDDAKQKIENFKNFLELRIEEGAATRKQLSPGRTAFLLSAFWHMKQKDQWPIFYFSSRRALKEDGLLGDGWAEYFAFAPVYVELAERLGISLWELTQLCVTINDQSDASDVDDGEVQPLGGITEGTGVWLIALGEKGVKFDECFDEGIIAIGWDYLGDLTEYPDRTAISEAIQKYRGNDVSPMNDSLACHQFANEMEVDDVVFAKRGRKEIMGYGVVTSEYRYEPDRGDYSNVRSVDWKSRGSWPRDNDLVNKTLTEISRYKKLVAGIQKDLGLIDPVIGPIERPPSAYGFDDALRDLFIPRADIETALSLLRYKKNLVLQGPPGTGKTFIAKRLAWLLLGEKDDDRIEQVQFHQSYSYEDFVQGYRPTDDGKFSRADGLFMRFCDKALQDDQSHYVLIIDEINRGNLSKIFGELLMLLEADKRSISWATTMTYAKEDEPRFYIPSNLHLIGTMNTADQSLAMVDYALRRRFAFRDVQPAFREPAFDRALDEMGASQDLKFKIIERMERLNRRLSDDDNLGEGFRIGHSYFCQTGEGSADEAWYGRVIESEIEPLLREYWKDNRERSDTEVKELLED